MMPFSQIVGLPASNWIATKFESRWPILITMSLHAVSLVLIGFSDSIIFLIVGMFMFAFFMRIHNIAMNTQALVLQKHYEKKINGSFHGLWSLGGITGVGITTVMVAIGVNIQTHFIAVAIFTIFSTFIAFRYLIAGDKAESGNKFKFGKPDMHTLILGFMVLFAAICEGGMFDWSGVYFKEVVQVEIFTAGYLVFMTCMTLSRFISDYMIRIIGMKSMYFMSSILITVGMCIAVLFPNFSTAMIGFSMVGFGTASIFPMTFFLAGTSKVFSPGLALSIVVTYAMVGVLVGPVLIGHIAHAFDLRASFLFLAFVGLVIIPLSRIYFRRYGEAAG